ncbi:MAG: nickel-responsive transcriptional regulator NikR [Candidatus Zhuqueibacterota bacterium]
MSQITRFGVSIENALLEKFDQLIFARSYKNRSEAIRDLIRNELVLQHWGDDEAESVGTITIIFDHHVRELTEMLTNVQHQFNEQIIAATHIHLDHHNCLEVIAVRGKTAAIRKISDKLISLRGVKHGKLVMTTTGKDV